MISFKQLSYALAVDEFRHFKKASEACFVSQSALSTAINELEKQLGFQVFERDNKKVLVTPLGEQFLAKAKQVKLQLDDIEALAQLQKTPLSYPMTLGVIPTIGPYLLPKVLPAVREKYPDFQLRIVEEQSHVLVDKVRNGEIDTAILAMPYATDGLHVFEFWQEDFFMVAHRSEPFAAQKEITGDELQKTHLMLLKEGHCLKDHALAACKLQPSDQDRDLASTSLHTLIQMVAGRMGTTLVPQMALDQLVANNAELKAVHLKEPGPHRRIAFITRLNYIGVANIELLMELFKQQLQKHCSSY